MLLSSIAFAKYMRGEEIIDITVLPDTFIKILIISPDNSYTNQEESSFHDYLQKKHNAIIYQANSKIPLEGLKEGKHGKRKGNKTPQLH